MTRGERFLIVNADDLGRTRGVNAGVFEAHRRGLVTSATLMVGFPAAEDAARALADHPDLGVGLHVTLTGAAPTLPASSVPSLVGAEGRFAARPEAMGDLDPGQVRAEVEHQLARFERLVGRAPTHLDSHHHSHRHPIVRDVLIDVARERHLPVRSSSDDLRRSLRSAGVPTTDRFIERFYGEATTLDVLLEILRGIEPGVTELMCHPGYVDDELRRGSSYAEERERELAVLCHPAALSLAAELGLRLQALRRGMRVLTFATEREAARAAALLLAAAAGTKPELVLGLPTGRTAIALYDALAELHRQGAIDLARARGFNLDELLLPASDPRTFRAFMEKHSWRRIGLDPARCAVPDSAAADPERECARYEAALDAAGGFDLALLGVGVDGHVAYNLPGTARAEAHVVELPDAVADSFAVPAAERPLRGLTLGLGALARARRLLLVALTADKAGAIRALIDGPEDPRWPCTALREHPQLDVVLTAQAAGPAA